jgi:hypothetical protein
VARHGAILTIRQVDEHLQNVVFVDIVETFPFPRQFSHEVQKFREPSIKNLVLILPFCVKPKATVNIFLFSRIFMLKISV